MSFLFPLGMAALGALVPLVALYLLKQKRVEVKVPTNFLWARALEDLRASSLFQRLRTTLLLVLQALAVVLFAMAAGGASLDLHVGEDPRHVILLLDRSASMKTVDEKDRARWEVAQDLAQELVGGLAGADEMMVVGFDAKAEVAQAFTSDRSRLREVIDTLRPRDLPTRAADALRLALAFSQASKGFRTEAYLLSDGAIPEELPGVPFPVTYVRVGSSGANQGITAVELARSPGEPIQAYVRIENGDVGTVERTVVLRRGAEVIDARAVTLPPGGDATAVFEIEQPEGEEPVVLTVALRGRDVLAADDAVPMVLRPAVPRSGLVVSREPSLYLDPAKLEMLHPGLAVVSATPEDAAAALAPGTTIDFVCFEDVDPATLPEVPAQIYVNSVPPDSGLTRAGILAEPIVIDWDRTHPATSRCQFDDVFVTEAMQLAGAGRSRTLVESTGGPLVLLTPVPGREVVVLAFSPAQSNLPLKLAWPLFLANTMDFLLGGVTRPGEEAFRPTGTPLEVTDASGAVLIAPSGDETTLVPDATGRIVHAGTAEAGVWRVRPDGGAERLAAFALLDADEVRVAPREEIVLGGEQTATATSTISRNVLLRDPLLLAALGLLLVEWAVWTSRR